MIYRTTNNVAVRFERPSSDDLARETYGQVSAMWQLCQSMARIGGAERIPLPVRLRRSTSPVLFAGRAGQ